MIWIKNKSTATLITTEMITVFENKGKFDLCAVYGRGLKNIKTINTYNNQEEAVDVLNEISELIESSSKDETVIYNIQMKG